MFKLSQEESYHGNPGGVPAVTNVNLQDSLTRDYVGGYQQQIM